MRFFATLVFATLFTATSAFSQEKIDTILDSKPGGLAGRMIEIVENSLGEKHGKRIVVDNCAAMKDYIVNSETPILGIGYPDMQVGGNENPCYQEESNFYGFLGASPMYLCVKNENADYAINSLFREKVFIGYADFPWFKHQSQKLIEGIGSNVKGIPYSGSSAANIALVNGEIDFMIGSSLKDGGVCPIILHDKLDNGAIIRGKDIFPDVKQAIFSYNVYLVGSNLPRNKDILELVLNSSFWKERTDNKYENFMENNNLSEQFNYLNESF
jgi:hypothetical protein